MNNSKWFVFSVPGPLCIPGFPSWVPQMLPWQPSWCRHTWPEGKHIVINQDLAERQSQCLKLATFFKKCAFKTMDKGKQVKLQKIIKWKSYLFFGLKNLGLLTGFSRRTVRSTTDTLGVGTRKAIPVSLLWGSESHKTSHHKSSTQKTNTRIFHLCYIYLTWPGLRKFSGQAKLKTLLSKCFV